MNINNNSDIMPILAKMCEHFADVANDRGTADPVILSGNYTREGLEADRFALETLIREYDVGDSELRHAYAVRDAVRAIVVLAVSGFILTTKYHAKDLGMENRLPKVPTVRSRQLLLLQVCATVIELWTSLNGKTYGALTLPLTLRNGYTLAQFIADVAILADAYNTIIKKQRAASINRMNRNIILARIKPHLAEYRLRIRVLYPADHVLVTSLPKLYNGDGPAAEAVQLTASWDEVTQKAVLHWTPNTQAELKHYVIRACSEGKYQSENDHTIATVDKDQTTYQTSEGLVAEGSIVFLKVYVITKGGRERGSNSVKVTRSTPATMFKAA
ncbi:MAG: hypothetical protein SFY80_15950 [Verrucomicrobiota bacterium]|nr:hypothetical protein [Verrucomicrobiota bacterium]